MTDMPSFRFGISEFTTWPWSFEEDVDRYADLGVEAIEVCEFKLNAQRISEQLARITERGLFISSVQPEVRTLFPSATQREPQAVPERMARFRDTIARFGARAEGVPFVTNTGIPPNGNIQLVLETAQQEYRNVADFAAERGASVALEPLNASIMNVESSIWTLQQAIEVVEAVDRPNFGICLDSWNIWQNADILEAIRNCDRILAVQLSDWRTPRSMLDRLIPGQGEIPLSPMLRAIHESGFRGPYVVEIFSSEVPDSLWEADLTQVIRDSRSGVERAWRAAFA